MKKTKWLMIFVLLIFLAPILSIILPKILPEPVKLFFSWIAWKIIAFLTNGGIALIPILILLIQPTVFLGYSVRYLLMKDRPAWKTYWASIPRIIKLPNNLRSLNYFSPPGRPGDDARAGGGEAHDGTEII